MRSSSGAILGLTLVAGLCTAAAAHAEETPQACEVPTYLLASDSPLPKVDPGRQGAAIR